MNFNLSNGMNARILFTVLLSTLHTTAFSQSDATLEETKEWIVDKLNQYVTTTYIKTSQFLLINKDYRITNDGDELKITHTSEKNGIRDTKVLDTRNIINKCNWKYIKIRPYKVVLEDTPNCNLIVEIVSESISEESTNLSGESHSSTVNTVNIPLKVELSMIERFDKAITHLYLLYTKKEKF